MNRPAAAVVIVAEIARCALNILSLWCSEEEGGRERARHTKINVGTR